MKLMFISKRRPQQRDLLDRPYGRFHNLPVELARLDCEVRVQLCSHHGLANEKRVLSGVTWSNLDIRGGLRSLLRSLEEEAQLFGPDWIIGCSDAWYGVLAKHLARKTGARLAIDAYDDYESYIPWNKPLHWAWRRALRSADVVTAAGPQLARLLDRSRKGRRPALVLPMAADQIFFPRDQRAARSALGLPLGAKLIGYCGSWTRSRGIDTLLASYRTVRSRAPEVCLVLTGRPPAYVLSEPGVIALGYVEDALLPLVLSSLDVACVITANTKFGRSSYPVKLCEAMACGVPTVATATEPVRWMLADDDHFLTPVDDEVTMAEHLLYFLREKRVVKYPHPTTWAENARLFENELRESQI